MGAALGLRRGARRGRRASRRSAAGSARPSTTAWGDLATFNRASRPTSGCVGARPPRPATPRGDAGGALQAGVRRARPDALEAWPAVADAGDRAAALRPQETSWRQGEDARTRLGTLRLFDYDGDGAPELLGGDRAPGRGRPATRVVVWRATATRLDPTSPRWGSTRWAWRISTATAGPTSARTPPRWWASTTRPNDALQGPGALRALAPGGRSSRRSARGLARNRGLCQPGRRRRCWSGRTQARSTARASAARVACAMLWRGAVVVGGRAPAGVPARPTRPGTVRGRCPRSHP